MQGNEERAGCKELSINNRQLRRMGNTLQGGAIEGNTADDALRTIRKELI
jgi:hypothetical protein